MAKLTLKKALTDVTVYLFVQDSSKTTGEGLTGLAYNTANLVASYVRPLGSRTAITLATLAEVTSAHTDGGFKEIDATNMPGVYRLDLPDAVCATGVPSAVVMLKGASNMTPVLLEIQLTDFDLNSTSNTVGTVTNLTNLPSIPNNWLTAAGIAADARAEIADAVWDEAISGHTTAGSFGAKNQKVVPSETIGDYKADVSSLATSAALATVGSNVTSIKTKTDNLPASPAAVGSPMTLTVGERTAIANEVESQIIDDTDAEKVLKAITDKIASVNPSLDDLTLAGIASAVRTELTTELARIDAAISTRLATAGYTAPANADISTIKSKTDNLPASPAASGEYTSALSAIQADLDNPNQYKADVSGLALEATLTAIKGATWTDETLVGLMTAIEGISAGSGASVADILNALLASYTVSGSVGEALGRLDNVQAKTDLITTGTTLTIASAVVGSTITAHRGDTLSAALENIGALTNYSKLWFTVKRDYDDADTAAVIQIEKTGGLLYLNGAVGTAGNGSLTINDVASGDVTIVLNASETAKLSPGNYQYDIQILRSAGTPVSTLTYGEFVVPADVTRATS